MLFHSSGLKDLADFLPATLATIVSYFSAEVTRGIWKPANMNGTDWPSPAANLSAVEQQIKKNIAAIGVDVPSLPIGKYLEILTMKSIRVEVFIFTLLREKIVFCIDMQFFFCNYWLQQGALQPFYHYLWLP